MLLHKLLNNLKITIVLIIKNSLKNYYSLLRLHIFVNMKLKDLKKEKKIKSVTLKIVQKQGLSGLSINSIAQKAKISPSNFYVYFKNKEKLLEQIFWEIIDNGISDIFKDAQKDLPYKLRFEKTYNTLISYKLEHYLEFCFIKQYIQSPFLKDHFNDKIDQSLKQLTDLFKEGQNEMILKDNVSTDLLFVILDGTIDKLIQTHQTNKIKLTKEIIDQSFTLVWDAIRQ